MAYNYLTSNYNRDLGLICESEEYNQTYWIYSDNFLAQLALSKHNSTLSGEISRTISRYVEKNNITSSHNCVVLAGEDIPDTLATSNQYVLSDYSPNTITIDLHNGSIMSDWYFYGDLLIYRALDCHWAGDETLAHNYYMKAYEMFDGK